MHCPKDAAWMCSDKTCLPNNHTRCCSAHPVCKKEGGVLPSKQCPETLAQKSESEIPQLLKCPKDYCRNGNCSVECDGKYKCVCQTGFVGQKCDKTDCKNDFCQNNGKCILTIENNKICDCKIGYFGRKCEFSICDTNPCQNGGK